MISGPYIFSLSSNCQATLSVTKRPDGLVTGVTVNRGGALNGAAGTATFTPATGRVALSGTHVDGHLLLMQGVNHTQTLRQMTLDENWPYSNTATTVTLNGIVYRGAYGKVTGGIVQQFSAVGREEGNQCVLYGIFTHK